MAGRLWTAEEDTFLEENCYRLAAWQIGKKLGRSEGAVYNRRQHLGMPKRNPELISGNAATVILGVAHTTARRWMREGLLPAVYRDGRGRWAHEWEVREGDLIAFLRKNPHLVDRDGVEPAYQQYVSERWVTLGEAFRRGAAHIVLLEHAALAGLLPEPHRRRGSCWVIPESAVPLLVAARRKFTTDREWRKQWARYDRTQRTAEARRKAAVAAAA